jgi:diguanylate cyclase (GGDEF)-like protein
MLRLATIEPGEVVMMGRDPSCHLVLLSGSVSRRHAAAESDMDGNIWLRDLGSTNGTFLNGERVDGRQPLTFGDRIDIGQLSLRLERMSDAEIAHIQRVAERLDTASHDPLTGAFTRHWLRDDLAMMVKSHREAGLPIAAVFLDIDLFKAINDTYLHATGDEVLKTVARLIAYSIRAADALVRYGGEEFVVFLAQCDERGAFETAERIRKRVAAHPWTELGIQREVTISGGVAQLFDTETSETWLERADQGLYQAKRGGRNRTMLGPSPLSLDANTRGE